MFKFFGKWILISGVLTIGFMPDAPASPHDEAFESLLRKPKLSQEVYEEIFFRFNDNPAALGPYAMTLWKSLSAVKDPLLKARSGWLVLLTTGDSDETKGVFKETMDLIDQHALDIPKNSISFRQMEFEIMSSQKTLDELGDGFLNIARKIEPPFLRLDALSSVAFHFASRSFRKTEIPILLNEIREFSEYKSAPITALNVSTIQSLSATLAILGEAEEAVFLNKRLVAFCNEHSLRSICGSIFYAQGLNYSKEDNPQSLELAIQDFMKSLKIRLELGDESEIAVSYYGLEVAYNEAKNYKEAIKYGKMAFEIYQRTKSHAWAAVTLKNLSIAYLAIGDKTSALNTAKKSLAINPPEFKNSLVGIYQQLSLVYHSLHQHQEAYRYLKLCLAQKDITGTDEETKKYLELGLKLEEERSAKLKDHLHAEEEKNALLFHQNELQARDLELTNRLRWISIALLGLLILSTIAMALAIRRRRQLTSAKAKIQTILDNIDEGLLTINEHMKIMDEHSPYVQRLFPQSTFKGIDIFEAILAKSEAFAEDLSIWQESLKACLGEDRIAWELNRDHFPKQIILASPHKRILSLHWLPMTNGHLIQSFLLSIRDVTSLKALEAQIIAERQRREGLQTYIAEILSHNFQEAQRLVGELGQALPHMPLQLVEKDSRSALLGRLHTSKGIARSLGLQILSRTIHALEDALKANSQPEDALDRLAFEQKSYFQVFEEILNGPQRADSVHDLFDTVSALLPDINRRMQDASLVLGEVAIFDHIVNWDAALLKDVRDILLHSLTNAVDHGFILPLARGHSLETPRFKIQAVPCSLGISLTVSDNGAGLDWARLAAIAQQRGFTPGPGQTLADVLLLEGVSTAEKISETSGRGVGLAAVKSICLERRGHLQVSSNPNGPGMVLHMVLQ